LAAAFIAASRLKEEHDGEYDNDRDHDGYDDIPGHRGLPSVQCRDIRRR